ncbi:GSCOCG00013121001-RA-CDS [Cotesia congregata]|uniref:Uncharacterized protein n=1 Tax=Cotesia congregata TaxID=51543 RepID=S6CWM0_COTCN|nr:GSCOCG00013121001-RA-CDS [Cotesia congregata]CCQ71289.1 hypothetical protein CcPL2.179 [Cotesia congregata]
MIRAMKSLKENGRYKHLEGKEGEKLTDYFYKRCGETEKALTKAGLDELVNFLLMNQEAKRSLHHFTVLNCPLLKQSQKHYILETSGIHLCYYMFQKHDCCSKFSHV